MVAMKTPKISPAPPPKLDAALIAVRLLLERGSISAAELADAGMVEPPAARKAMARLGAALGRHVKLAQSVSPSNRPHQRLRLASTGQLPPEPPPANFDRLTALAIANELAAPFSGTLARSALEDELAAASLALDQPPIDPARRILGRGRALAPILGRENDLDIVLAALFGNLRITCTYADTKGVATELELEPLSLVLGDLGLHLFARCVTCEAAPDRVDVRLIYAFDRMSKLKIGDRFTYPATDKYNPDRLFAHCWGALPPRDEGALPEAVELAFDPSWATFLAFRRLHPTQSCDARVDGATNKLVVGMTLYVTYDLVHWIRGHGSLIEVRGPQLLADWVKSGGGVNWLAAEKG